jgi:hypothetical protein
MTSCCVFFGVWPRPANLDRIVVIESRSLFCPQCYRSKHVAKEKVALVAAVCRPTQQLSSRMKQGRLITATVLQRVAEGVSSAGRDTSLIRFAPPCTRYAWSTDASGGWIRCVIDCLKCGGKCRHTTGQAPVAVECTSDGIAPPRSHSGAIHALIRGL